MTRADLKHCGKIPEAREESNRSVREGRVELRHYIKSLEGMESSNHFLGYATFELATIPLLFCTYVDEAEVSKRQS